MWFGTSLEDTCRYQSSKWKMFQFGIDAEDTLVAVFSRIISPPKHSLILGR